MRKIRQRPNPNCLAEARTLSTGKGRKHPYDIMQAASSAPTPDSAMPSCPERRDDERWYALWVYRNLVAPVFAVCQREGIRCYRPMRLAERYTTAGMEYVEEVVIPGLLFVRTTAVALERIKQASANRAVACCYPGTRLPAPIDDRTMEQFMFVVKASAHRLDAVELPIDKGDKVRVTEGIFKGAEGYIRRVHGTKRFVVAVEGVAAVAIAHIPRQFLEKVDTAQSLREDSTTQHPNA